MERSTAKARLRELGLRVTGPRVAVLSLLAEADRPVSHSDVVEVLGSDTWSASTLYRNLRKLVEVGLARVTNRADGIDRYELARPDEPHDHPHFVCEDCGSVRCLPDTRIARRPQDPGWQASLRAATVQLVGRCPDCCIETDADGGGA